MCVLIRCQSIIPLKQDFYYTCFVNAWFSFSISLLPVFCKKQGNNECIIKQHPATTQSNP